MPREKQPFAILMDIDQGGLTLDRLMDRFHRGNELDRRDESFVTAIVYGALRWRRRLGLDHQQGFHNASWPNGSLVVNILRMGLYQIIFMDRVPNSAAVNTSVELAKALKKKMVDRLCQRRVATSPKAFIGHRTFLFRNGSGSGAGNDALYAGMACGALD